MGDREWDEHCDVRELVQELLLNALKKACPEDQKNNLVQWPSCREFTRKTGEESIMELIKVC